MPQAAEQGEIERLHRAATVIQHSWRSYCARKALDAAAAAGQPAGGPAGPAAAAVMAGLGRRGPLRRLDSMLAAVETVEGAGDPHSECGAGRHAVFACRVASSG